MPCKHLVVRSNRILGSICGVFAFFEVANTLALVTEQASEYLKTDFAEQLCRLSAGRLGLMQIAQAHDPQPEKPRWRALASMVITGRQR